MAAGQALPVAQSEVTLKGHAMEARLYVEDPYAGFAPQTGTVRWWRPEQARLDGVRIDDGIEEGSEISPFYDPMVAKVIVHGRDRDDAIRRLRAALRNTPLLGLRNNGRFLADLVNHPAFRGAAMTTASIDQWQDCGEALLQRPQPDELTWSLAAAVFASQHGAGWRADSVAAFDIPLHCGEITQTLRVHPDLRGNVGVVLAGRKCLIAITEFAAGALRFEIDGVTRRAVAVLQQSQLHLALDGNSFVFSEISPFPGKDQVADARQARSPVAGKVTQIKVVVGDTVADAQQLLCVEAMKMEMWLTAQVAGKVVAVHASVGDQVESGALLVEIEPEVIKEA